MNYIKYLLLVLVITMSSTLLSMRSLSLFGAGEALVESWAPYSVQSAQIFQGAVMPKAQASEISEPLVDDGVDYFEVHKEYCDTTKTVSMAASELSSLPPSPLSASSVASAGWVDRAEDLTRRAARTFECIVHVDTMQRRKLGLETNSQEGLAEWEATQKLYNSVQEKYEKGIPLTPRSLGKIARRSTAVQRQANNLFSVWKMYQKGVRNGNTAQQILKDVDTLIVNNRQIIGPQLLHALNEVHLQASRRSIEEITQHQRSLPSLVTIVDSHP